VEELGIDLKLAAIKTARASSGTKRDQLVLGRDNCNSAFGRDPIFFGVVRGERTAKIWAWRMTISLIRLGGYKRGTLNGKLKDWKLSKRMGGRGGFLGTKKGIQDTRPDSRKGVVDGNTKTENGAQLIRP